MEDGAIGGCQHSHFRSSVLLLLVDGGGLDAVDLILDVLAAIAGESVGLEASLRASLTACLAHISVLAEPLHVQDTLKVSSLVSVLVQQSGANILSSLTDALPRMEGEVGGVLDGLSGDLLVVLVVEGEHAGEEQVGDDTEGPVVDLLAVRLLEKDLGRDIRERAEGIQAGLVGANNLGETEIHNLKRSLVRVVSHQDVLRLEIAMGHTVGVEVVEGGSDLVRELLGALLSHSERALFQVGEEITSVELLHNDIDVVLVLKKIKKTDDMRVLAHLEDFDLTTLQLHILHGHLLFGHDLHGDGLARLLVDSGLDETEFTLAESLFDLIEVKDIGVSDDLFDGGHPTLLLGTISKVVASSLVGREDELEGVQHGGAIKLLFSLILDEHANK